MSSQTPPLAEQPQYHLKLILLCFAIGLILWNLPHPDAFSPIGWHALVIFVTTIFALIIKPLPLGAIAMISLVVGILTHTITRKQAFTAFSSDVVWLVVFALFIAKGFSVTGLGNRIAYFFTSIFGRKTLSLSYGLMLTDLILAPAIPSVTARAAGIIYPIVRSISNNYKSFPNCDSSKKIGGFLVITAFQVTTITSAMFMTAMAANPLIVTLAEKEGYTITWGTWALGASLPGIISLVVVPWFIFKIFPPLIKSTPDAQTVAKSQLNNLGPVNKREYVMIGTVITLLGLWIFGGKVGIDAVTAAMIGLSILILTGVLDWKTLMKLDTAWETFFWFCTLILFSSLLKEYGVLTVITDYVQTNFGNVSWHIAFPVMALVYFYSHYLFASSTAHITSMFSTFFVLAIALGTPAWLALLVFMYFSNLFGGLTNYSLAPAPLLFGAGYVEIKTWWKIGFLVSVINLIIWCTAGLAWWKMLGLF
jgi:DASS family divalent anion:Na+ symporter